ncbi:MAG TPA: caspase family protein [Anaerolineales bacterium]|nr:caspase family protein [Anaerolineales bacterium]
MKKALCVGINNYPGTLNDLQGCVNDANDWSTLLTESGFETSLILDSQATRQNIKTALDDLVMSAGQGDVIVFTYSGHGTQSFDFGDDEGDTYDEALSVYDGTILDDEMRAIINRVHPAATLLIISDSCFSGSVTRLSPAGAQPRFMRTEGFSVDRVVRQRFLLPESGMPELLISGCSDSEYSYDAEIDGRYNGAMSAMAIRVIRQNPGLTYNEFYTRLRGYLPSSDFPQSPQLEGSDSHKNTRLFEPFAASEPGPTPAPPPTPAPDGSPGCVAGLVRLFKGG